MAHTTWKSVADDLVTRDWGTEEVSILKAIQSHGDSRLQLCLLIDIAKSLRALRCANFVGMPHNLQRTMLAVEGLRRDQKKRRNR